jgi:hypothetical protein
LERGADLFIDSPLPRTGLAHPNAGVGVGVGIGIGIEVDDRLRYGEGEMGLSWALQLCCNKLRERLSGSLGVATDDGQEPRR